MSKKYPKDFTSTLILENLLRSFPGHIYWKDLDGAYLGCNDQQAYTVGYKNRQEIIGKTDFEMPWFDAAEMVRANDAKIISTGVGDVFEEKSHYYAKNRTFSSIKSPLKNNAGKVMGVLGITIEITDKLQLEQMQKEKEIAQKNSELMNILSGSLAHEIRTPLAIIKINTDLINHYKIMEKILNEDIKEQFSNNIDNIYQAIKECTQVMDMLLVKLRQMGKLDNSMNLWEQCSMKNTLDLALAEYPFRKGEKNLLNYGDSESDFLYMGNSRLTKHIIFNLLKNALYIIHNEGYGVIFIETHIGHDYNRLIFRDTSSGISKDYLPKIFNKFETTDDAHSGTGLGLAFCKLVMESYGGKIECCSELTKFTEFTLFFPVIDKISV